MAEQIDFLEHFNRELKSLYGESSSYRYLFTKSFQLHDLTYTSNVDNTEIVKKIDSLNEVITNIQNIIYKPHTLADERTTVKRSNLSGALSPYNFKETVKDSKCWGVKDGEYVPEYVHTSEVKTKYDIYENQFICFLIDEIERVAKDIVSYSDILVEPIGKMYDFVNPTFGKLSIFNNFYGTKLPINLYDENKLKQEGKTPVRAQKLLKKILRIKHTSFYKRCHNEEFSPNVIKTNILVHDVNYYACYEFYESHKNNNELRNKSNSIQYWNYVVSTIISFLETSNLFNKATHAKAVMMDNNILTIEGLELLEKDFEYIFDFDYKNFVISIKSRVLGKKHEDIEDNLGLIVIPKVTRSNLELLRYRLKDYEKVFDSYVVITGENETTYFNDLAILNPFRKSIEKTLTSIFMSKRIIYRVPKDYFDTKCPYCGEENVMAKDGKHTCLSCGTNYILIKDNDCDYAWLTKLGRVK